MPLGARIPPNGTGGIEWVNGGYGVKNPMLKTGAAPPDIDPSPDPASEPGAYTCRTCGKV